MTQSNTEKQFPAITARENWLGQQVVDVAITIHKAPGPGLLEIVNEKVFCYELAKRNIPFLKQKRVAILYDELVVEDALTLDILID